jgi:hypothetical protein
MDPSNSAILEFCRFASSNVSVEDFRDFCPNDPGHANYVRILETFHSSLTISKEDGAYLSDAYFWTSDDGDLEEAAKTRLRYHRIFLNAIALFLIRRNDYCEALYPANYSAAELLMDSHDFNKVAIDLLSRSFEEAGQILTKAHQTESLYFRFGQIVLSERFGDAQKASQFASKLLAEEADMVSDPKAKYQFHDSRFLLGASGGFDRYDIEWKYFASNLQNPANDLDIALVKDVIQNDSWPGAPAHWQVVEPSTDH